MAERINGMHQLRKKIRNILAEMPKFKQVGASHYITFEQSEFDNWKAKLWKISEAR